jgi:hypothetical protein
VSELQDAFDAVVAQLRTPNDRPAPARIEKGCSGVIVGNTPALMPVCADEFGRLWREDRDALVLVYDPVWHQ